MTRSFIFFVVLLLGSLSSTDAFAQQGPDRQSIQKVIDEICSDGGAWLKCYSLEPSRCQAVTAGFVEPCVQKVMQSPSDDQTADGVAKLLICFNRQFMAKYGIGEVKTPECADPMKHLTHSK